MDPALDWFLVRKLSFSVVRNGILCLQGPYCLLGIHIAQEIFLFVGKDSSKPGDFLS